MRIGILIGMHMSVGICRVLFMEFRPQEVLGEDQALYRFPGRKQHQNSVPRSLTLWSISQNVLGGFFDTESN